ncbi:MAG: preprotein translocase subunit SecE [bacterium]|nr:preprotein translocase subunit SecE [bacterium]
MANETKEKKPNIFVRIKIFLREVKIELQKVAWPDRKSVAGSTGVVAISVVITLIYLYLLDIALSTVLTYLFR